jgi:hypothetical protein
MSFSTPVFKTYGPTTSKDGRFSTVVIYDLTASSTSDTPYGCIAKVATTYPFYSAYSGFSNAIVREINPRLISTNGTQTYWECDVVYNDDPLDFMVGGVGSMTPSGAPVNKSTTDPDEWPWEIEYGTQFIKVAMPVDLNGDPVVNNAGIPLILEREVVIPTIHITSWQPLGSWSPDHRSIFIGTSNDDTWQGYDEYYLFCKNLTGTSFYDKGAYWIRRHVELWEAPGVFNYSWEFTELSNSGTMQVVDGEYVPCVDYYGNPASEPMLLQADGSQTPPGTPSDEPTLPFKTALAVDWDNIL